MLSSSSAFLRISFTLFANFNSFVRVYFLVAFDIICYRIAVSFVRFFAFFLNLYVCLITYALTLPEPVASLEIGLPFLCDDETMRKPSINSGTTESFYSFPFSSLSTSD